MSGRRAILGTATIRGAVVTLAFGAGCAAQGGDDGGSSRLPDRGIAGWEREERDVADPYVIGLPEGDRVGGASALVVGGALFVYAHRLLADGGAELVRARREGDGFAVPEALALSSAPMLGHDPSVVVGDDGRVWIAWVDADGALALARSDDGVSFTALAASGLDAGSRAPSLVLEGDRVRLFASRDGAIVHAEADRDALAFGPEVEVFGPGEGCVDRAGATEPCWDGGAIVEAEVRRAKAPTGDTVYRMFFAGRGAAGDSDVGFAASYDGLTFSRYAYNPVLADTRDELSPSAALFEGRYLLFWSETRGAKSAGILRATHAPSAIADRW